MAEVLWHGLAGQRVYVPQKPTSGSELARLIGLDKAVMIGAEIGGTVVAIPCGIGIRHRRVIRLRKAAVPVREIVKKTGYSERQVFRLIAEARAAGLLPPKRGSVTR